MEKDKIIETLQVKSLEKPNNGNYYDFKAFYRFTGRSVPLIVKIEFSKVTCRVPSQLNMAIISP
jgi:hypothetical protein